MTSRDQHSGPPANALDRFDAIETKLANRRASVFLDYDGTLTPIVARPDLAILSNTMRATLQALAAQCSVAVVSGRDLDDVRRLVGLDGIVYAGSHGFDIAGPGGLSTHHDHGALYAAAVEKAAANLRPAAAAVAGALVEQKRFAVAVHYRQVADGDIPSVETAVDETLAAVPELRKTLGKKVFELRPRFDWDKGKAVLWMLSALGEDRDDVMPIYIGDDQTDEDAFRALAGRGVTIHVGPGGTAANYVLDDTDAVERFLRALTDLLAHRQP